MKNLRDKRVLVLGLGLSGLALVRWCLRFGAQVTVADTRPEPPQLAALRHHCPQAVFISGSLTADLVQGSQLRGFGPGVGHGDLRAKAQAPTHQRQTR